MLTDDLGLLNEIGRASKGPATRFMDAVPGALVIILAVRDGEYAMHSNAEDATTMIDLLEQGIKVTKESLDNLDTWNSGPVAEGD